LSSATSLDGTEVVPVLPPQLSTKEQRAEQRRARDWLLSSLELHERGWSAPAIARQLALVAPLYFVTYAVPHFQSAEDVAIAVAACLTRIRLSAPTLNDGCVRTVVWEIKARGYPGSYDTVARYARRFRQARTLQRKRHSIKKLLPKVREPQNALLHRVVQHIWCCSDRNYENQTQNNSCSSWHSILNSLSNC